MNEVFTKILERLIGLSLELEKHVGGIYQDSVRHRHQCLLKHGILDSEIGDTSGISRFS